MLPNIWIIDTYSIMILIGVILCFYIFYKYSIKYKNNKNYAYDILLLACAAIIGGILSATLFQTLFDYIKDNTSRFNFKMTFFGGLVGGVVVFILGYMLYIKKKYPESSIAADILPIAPACITCAHAFGRIGCFLAGCCYGGETDSIFGVTFPGMDHAVHPTQLYEATFLIILSSVLTLLAYKKNCIYTMPIYLVRYGIFRFLIEFVRGDDRGAYFFNISPSQCFSILAILISIILAILIKFNIIKNKR